MSLRGVPALIGARRVSHRNQQQTFLRAGKLVRYLWRQTDQEAWGQFNLFTRRQENDMTLEAVHGDGSPVLMLGNLLAFSEMQQHRSQPGFPREGRCSRSALLPFNSGLKSV